MTGEDKSETASEASAPKPLRPLPDRPQDQTEDFHGHLMDLMVSVGAELPEVIRHEDLDAVADLVSEWRETALREFVMNEDLDVRRCIIPGLPLRAGRYPADLHELVQEAVRIARAHPDDYIRHRVEIQTGGG